MSQYKYQMRSHYDEEHMNLLLQHNRRRGQTRDGDDTIRLTGAVFVVMNEMLLLLLVVVVVEEVAEHPHPLSGKSSIHSSGF
jgi:hypothetical protein